MLCCGLIFAGACSDDTGTQDSAVQQDSAQVDQGTKIDQGTTKNDTGGTTPDSAPPDATAGTKKVGEACSADGECISKACFKSKCAKNCTQVSDCGSKETCGTKKPGGVAFCYLPSFDVKIGTSCAATISSPTTACSSVGSSFKCYYGPLPNLVHYCSKPCTDSTDCPLNYACLKGSTSSVCIQNKYCAYCTVDANCPTGYKCIKSGKA